MEAKNDGGPAFPATEANGCNSGVPGMTLRDYFAAKAMQAAISSQRTFTDDRGPINDPTRYAYLAYGLADAMLAARQA